MNDDSRAKDGDDDDDDSPEQKERTSVDRSSLPTLEEAAIESHKKSFPELVRDIEVCCQDLFSYYFPFF